MDLGELFWDCIQDGNISGIRAELERQQSEQDEDVKTLLAQNNELKLRLGLLIRLLIDNKVITAQDYANLIAAARPSAA